MRCPKRGFIFDFFIEFYSRNDRNFVIYFKPTKSVL